MTNNSKTTLPQLRLPKEGGLRRMIAFVIAFQSVPSTTNEANASNSGNDMSNATDAEHMNDIKNANNPTDATQLSSKPVTAVSLDGLHGGPAGLQYPPDEDDEEPEGLDKIKSRREPIGRYLGWHLRRQLSIVFFIAIIERGSLLDDSKKCFELFRVLFELDNFAFSGALHPLSKIIVMITMVRGRHRGLPVAVDRVALLPSDLVTQNHESNNKTQQGLQSGETTENAQLSTIFDNYKKMRRAEVYINQKYKFEKKESRKICTTMVKLQASGLNFNYLNEEDQFNGCVFRIAESGLPRARIDVFGGKNELQKPDVHRPALG
ncbi:hypothetical protein BJ912DRAFT_1038825 [Pholiota molesta]|nr:hypothetical protein BJ912DRAFT_1038825 [Pholiota molesta]